MSSRPAGRTAFEGLKPTIIREPRRSQVPSEAEARLLETEEGRPESARSSGAEMAEDPAKSEARVEVEPAASFGSTKLLTKKKRDVLIPVTFRMPQSLKLRLEKIARDREINQTDLINEAIELNLSRYA